MRVFHHPAHALHHGTELDRGRLGPSWECPERAELVREALVAGGHHDLVVPQTAGLDALAALHAPDYLEFLATAHERWRADGRPGDAMGFGWVPRGAAGRRPCDLDGQLGWYAYAADCSITEGTWTAATASVGVALAAADHVAAGARWAFGLCRPPGHHATRDQFGGYCYLNNAGLAAQHLRDGGAARVSVLDVDYHHGNGTQALFWRRGDVQFVSVHADPATQFPWFSGYADETGAGPGEGSTRNLPLPRGTSGQDWLAALDEALALVAGFGPDALVVSLGVDTGDGDPISDFHVTPEQFRVAGAAIARLGRPTALVLEGGYATAAIGPNVAAVLEGSEG